MEIFACHRSGHISGSQHPHSPCGTPYTLHGARTRAHVRAVSSRNLTSYKFNSQHVNLGVSNPKTTDYVHFKVPFESSNLPGAGPISRLSFRELAIKQLYRGRPGRLGLFFCCQALNYNNNTNDATSKNKHNSTTNNSNNYNNTSNRNSSSSSSTTTTTIINNITIIVIILVIMVVITIASLAGPLAGLGRPAQRRERGGCRSDCGCRLRLNKAKYGYVSSQ